MSPSVRIPEPRSTLFKKNLGNVGACALGTTWTRARIKAFGFWRFDGDGGPNSRSRRQSLLPPIGPPAAIACEAPLAQGMVAT